MSSILSLPLLGVLMTRQDSTHEKGNPMKIFCKDWMVYFHVESYKSLLKIWHGLGQKPRGPGVPHWPCYTKLSSALQAVSVASYFLCSTQDFKKTNFSPCSQGSTTTPCQFLILTFPVQVTRFISLAYLTSPCLWLFRLNGRNVS